LAERIPLTYALQEKKVQAGPLKPVVLAYNNVFGTSRDIGFKMKDIAGERPAVKKPVLHVQINFHPDEQPTKKQAQRAIDSILKDIGIDKENHQYVVVQHRNTAHDHYHAVINRVGLDGSLMNDHRIIDRLQVACDKVEKLQGLRRTQNRTVIYDPHHNLGYSYVKRADRKAEERKPIHDKNEAKKEVKEHIQGSLIDALGTAKSSTELRDMLVSKGIETRFLESVKGIYGVSFRYDEIAVKGSDVGFKWAEVAKIMEANQDLSVKELATQRQLEEAKSGISKEISQKLGEYIKAHTLDPAVTATGLADQAIRSVMQNVFPKANPWSSWRGFKGEEENNRKLHDYAEQKIKDGQRKLAAYSQDKALYEAYGRGIETVAGELKGIRSAKAY